MEPTLPVLVVGPGAPALLDVLRGQGLDPRPCGPEDVLGLLATGVADAVLALPVPGWRLLLSRAVTSGATAVLHVARGRAPGALPSGVVAITRAEDLAAVLTEARHRRGVEPTPAHVSPTLEQRLADAERFS